MAKRTFSKEEKLRIIKEAAEQGVKQMLVLTKRMILRFGNMPLNTL
jgi:transposase-like protein